MSDPAIEAAQRACSAYDVDHPRNCLEVAAREALKPIWELHVPIRVGWTVERICKEDRASWPCATAKLIYTSEELA